jgi:hypothetical protein
LSISYRLSLLAWLASRCFVRLRILLVRLDICPPLVSYAIVARFTGPTDFAKNNSPGLGKWRSPRSELVRSAPYFAPELLAFNGRGSTNFQSACQNKYQCVSQGRAISDGGSQKGNADQNCEAGRKFAGSSVPSPD